MTITDRNDHLHHAIAYTRDLAGDLRERADRLDQQVERLRRLERVVAGEDVEGFSPLPMGIAGTMASTARDVSEIVSHSLSHLGFIMYLLAQGAAEFGAQDGGQ